MGTSHVCMSQKKVIQKSASLTSMVLDNHSQCVNGIFRYLYCCYKREKKIIKGTVPQNIFSLKIGRIGCMDL